MLPPVRHLEGWSLVAALTRNGVSERARDALVAATPYTRLREVLALPGRPSLELVLPWWGHPSRAGDVTTGDGARAHMLAAGAPDLPEDVAAALLVAALTGADRVGSREQLPVLAACAVSPHRPWCASRSPATSAAGVAR
jgi:hypothetical protein